MSRVLRIIRMGQLRNHPESREWYVMQLRKLSQPKRREKRIKVKIEKKQVRRPHKYDPGRWASYEYWDATIGVE